LTIFEDKETEKKEKVGKHINYYVLAAIFGAIVLFDITSAMEPQVDAELDFYELMHMLGFAAASIFAFAVAKRYGKSKVFGRAYLALGIGFGFYFAGELFWYVYAVGYQIENPYPYWSDIGYFGFYPFAIYHLRTNVHFFKRQLARSQKILLIAIPSAVTILYIVALLVPVGMDENVIGNPSLNPEEIGEETSTYRIAPRFFDYVWIEMSQERDQQYWNGVYMGTAYVAATTVTFTYAILGAQVFRGSILGTPWGLLLLGIGLNWVADIHYYYSSIYYFDRTNPVHSIWLASTMIICYALYKHREL
jgi:hypothetical protein